MQIFDVIPSVTVYRTILVKHSGAHTAHSGNAALLAVSCSCGGRLCWWFNHLMEIETQDVDKSDCDMFFFLNSEFCYLRSERRVRVTRVQWFISFTVFV